MSTVSPGAWSAHGKGSAPSHGVRKLRVRGLRLPPPVAESSSGGTWRTSPTGVAGSLAGQVTDWPGVEAGASVDLSSLGYTLPA